MPAEHDLAAERAKLRAWLFDSALPLWSSIGVDREAGGFFEKLTPDGLPTDDPRRARLVARQIYAFATAEKLGWTGPARALVRHGLQALFTRHLGTTGLVVPEVDRAGRVLRTHFDLYDHAFVLFALAAAAEIGERPDELAARARLLLAEMKAGFSHPVAGFEEGAPRSLPLKANPHMHLLEACLAWEMLAPADGWNLLADEIAELCLARFIDPITGAVHEYFDGDWMRLPDLDGSVVEPGHQFEWAWLLMRWGRARGRTDALAAAQRMLDLAERFGVDEPTDMVVGGLSAELRVRDNRARLWPQTERIKAHVLAAVLAASVTPAGHHLHLAQRATKSLWRFLDCPIEGAWNEYFDSVEDSLTDEPTRASSLYHIICAMEVIEGI